MEQRELTDSGAERRESPRVRVRLMARDLGEGGSFTEHDGNVSLGGAFIQRAEPPVGHLFEVRIRLPRLRREVRVRAEVLRVSEDPTQPGVHLRFVPMDLESELAIAQYLDDVLLQRLDASNSPLN